MADEYNILEAFDQLKEVKRLSFERTLTNSEKDFNRFKSNLHVSEAKAGKENKPNLRYL